METVREVEIARLDEMLTRANTQWSGMGTRGKLQILDRKYRLMGLYAAGPQIVVGIGLQQGRHEPRIVDSVADQIPDEST